MDIGGQVGPMLAQPGRIIMQDGMQNFQHGFAAKDRFARQHLVKDRAEAPEVGAAVDRFSRGLLGRHVKRRASRRASRGRRHIA